MRTANRTRITAVLLVGATLLLTGCGDQGDHLPAGMSGSSSMYGTGGGDLLGGDPGPLDAGVRSGVDDPVLTDTSSLDEVGALSTDDPFQEAVSDWNEDAGVLGEGIDDLDAYADMEPIGYGGGYGGGYGSDWGRSGYGYGAGVLGAAAYGSAVGMGAGFVDPGFEDPGMLDAGLEDPGFIDGGFDAGFVDAGLDVGFVDAGFDAGFDPGMDAGFVDAGVADVGFAGGFDPGMDAGFVDAGVADAGFVDVGGFDAGFGF